MPGTWKSALIVSQLSYKSKIKSLLKKKKEGVKPDLVRGA